MMYDSFRGWYYTCSLLMIANMDQDSLHIFRVAFMTKDIEINGKNIIYLLWDTAGQERVRGSGFNHNYYGTSHQLPISFALL